MALTLRRLGLSLRTTCAMTWISVVTSLEFNILLYFHKAESVDGDADIQYEDLDQNFDDFNNSG